MKTGRSQRNNEGLRENNIFVKLADYTLPYAGIDVYVTANTANPSWTLTLPPVGEARGETVCVHAILIANSETVTIEDQNTDGGLAVDALIVETGQILFFYSNGRSWIPLKSMAKLSVDVIAATALAIGSQNVSCTANTATDNYTVTLPPVAASAGDIISISAIIANSKAVTVTDYGSETSITDVVLNTTLDNLVLYSTGVYWRKIFNGEV